MISEQGAPAARYAYKASLVGAAHQFELTEQGLSWRVAGRSGVWPYADIATIRLSYRPVSMQSRRFRADIEKADGARIAILSTSWQTAALMAAQDQDYRAFITQLHVRMARAGSRALLVGGLKPRVHAAAIICVTLVAVAMAGLFVRSHRNRRMGGGAVSGRLRRLVCVAGRRLHHAQPAAGLHLRSFAQGAVALKGAVALNRNRSSL